MSAPQSSPVERFAAYLEVAGLKPQVHGGCIHIQTEHGPRLIDLGTNTATATDTTDGAR
jgi:hypothetical protein